MSATLPLRAGLAVCLCVAAVWLPSASADGDPASDVLFGGTLFLPYTTRVSAALAAQVRAATRETASSGAPERVALIAGRGDLGAVPSLFGKPAAYARFLSLELQFVYAGRILVVMPQGVALARAGRSVPAPALARLRPGRGGAALARAALSALRSLGGRAKSAPAAQAAPPARAASAAPPSSEPRAGITAWRLSNGKAVAIAAGGTGTFVVVGLGLVWWRRRSFVRTAAW